MPPWMNTTCVGVIALLVDKRVIYIFLGGINVNHQQEKYNLIQKEYMNSSVQYSGF
jgi:hypothetical protein